MTLFNEQEEKEHTHSEAEQTVFISLTHMYMSQDSWSYTDDSWQNAITYCFMRFYFLFGGKVERRKRDTLYYYMGNVRVVIYFYLLSHRKNRKWIPVFSFYISNLHKREVNTFTDLLFSNVIWYFDDKIYIFPTYLVFN